MYKLIVVLVVFLIDVRGDLCHSRADCYYNGECLNSTCVCGDSYRGPNCGFEIANCTLSQIRIDRNEYQICLTIENAEKAWGPICSDINLCQAVNVLCPNCNFVCSSTPVCQSESFGCIVGTNSTDCVIVNGANTISYLLLITAIIAMLPILI
ncbi:hypothetical protein LOD99_141 [Oopsacas minuta]|uniref:EGF-like domain-containing protein n=1 Tax=Oopsacas minuta TaxID=111878 RepID=A0AAV7K8D1_9METZ|nr:hypothetical protein LOD99_141 [Oopsacas minuta]